MYLLRLRLRVRLHQMYIVWMKTNRLTGRIGSVPILSIKWPVSIDTMINLDGDGDRDGDGHGDGDSTCKQALTVVNCNAF